jgi:hypothetical protein
MRPPAVGGRRERVQRGRVQGFREIKAWRHRIEARRGQFLARGQLEHAVGELRVRLDGRRGGRGMERGERREGKGGRCARDQWCQAGRSMEGHRWPACHGWQRQLLGEQRRKHVGYHVGTNNSMYYSNPRRVGYIVAVHIGLDGPVHMGHGPYTHIL